MFTNYGDWYSAYTARLGYAVDRSLFYAKGGAVVMRVETGVLDTTGAVTSDSTTRKWEVGYAVGGGWEYAIDSKWSVKAEYLYFGFGKFDTSAPAVGNPGVGTGFSTTSLAGIHTAKIGLNYKWDWFGLFH